MATKTGCENFVSMRTSGSSDFLLDSRKEKFRLREVETHWRLAQEGVLSNHANMIRVRTGKRRRGAGGDSCVISSFFRKQRDIFSKRELFY